MSAPLLVALAGQPNCGKSTLFNMLTGARQHVANYPGVTVEKKTGFFTLEDHRVELVDLPGTYSLTSYSLEEKTARDFILHAAPQVTINVADAANLKRNLYLTLQLLEMETPLVLALNMMDVAERRNIQIDTARGCGRCRPGRPEAVLCGGLRGSGTLSGGPDGSAGQGSRPGWSAHALAGRQTHGKRPGRQRNAAGAGCQPYGHSGQRGHAARELCRRTGRGCRTPRGLCPPPRGCGPDRPPRAFAPKERAQPFGQGGQVCLPQVFWPAHSADHPARTV